MTVFIRRLLTLLVFTALGLITYINALPNSFHYDDFPTIVQNGAIRDLRLIPSYFTDTSTWTISRLRDWRPVVLATFAINYAIGGTNPIIFRSTNLLIHTATAFLLYLILQNILQRSERAVSASARAPNAVAISAALLFLVHTANSEVVNYVFARSTLLSSFFLVAAFYCYLRGPHGETPQRRDLVWEVAGLALYALGLASKATAITLPILLFVFEVIFLNPRSENPLRLFRRGPKRLRKYGPLLLVAFAYIAIRQIVAPRALARMATSHGLDYLYFLTQLRAWVYYIGLLFWPAGIVSDYSGFRWSQTFWDHRVLVSSGIVAAILAIAWALWKRAPIISFFILWYFITLLPEASIIPLSDAVNAYRSYPANLGATAAITVAGAKVIVRLSDVLFSRGNRLATFCRVAGLSVLLAVLVASTWQRNEVFRDDGTFWSDVLEKDPGNVRALLGLGSFMLDEQKYLEAQRYFDKAIQLDDTDALPYLFKGYLSALLLRYQEALEFYDTAVKLDPQDAYVYLLRAGVHKNLKDYKKALADLDEALRLRPHYTEARLTKGAALLDMHEDQQAYEVCSRGMASDPNEPGFYLCLGRILENQNRTQEAIRVYETAVARGLQNQEAWYRLGMLYSDAGLYTKARDAFQEASRLMGHIPVQARPNFFGLQEKLPNR